MLGKTWVKVKDKKEGLSFSTISFRPFHHAFASFVIGLAVISWCFLIPVANTDFVLQLVFFILMLPILLAWTLIQLHWSLNRNEVIIMPTGIHLKAQKQWLRKKHFYSYSTIERIRIEGSSTDDVHPLVRVWDGPYEEELLMKIEGQDLPVALLQKLHKDQLAEVLPLIKQYLASFSQSGLIK